MDSSLVGWILTGIVALFLLFGIMWGAIRGLIKSGFRTGWIVLTAVILLFLTPIITSSIYTVNLSFAGDMLAGMLPDTVTLPATLTIQSLIDWALASYLPFDVSELGATIELIQNLPFLLINAFVFLLLFWLTKVVLWPIWAIIAATVPPFKKKRKDGTPRKKFRLAGMAVGVVLGLFVASMTLMPVLGILDIVVTVDRKTAEKRGPSANGLVTELAGAEAMSYVMAYENSPARYILRYTGMEWVGNIFYTKLSTVTVGDGASKKSVNLKEEIVNAAMLAADGQELFSMFAMLQDGTITQDDLMKMLGLARDVVNGVFDSNIVKIVADELIPVLINMLLDESDDAWFKLSDLKLGNDRLEDLLTGSLTEFKKVVMDTIKHDVNQLFDIADALGESGILLELLKPASGTVNFEFILSKIDDTLIKAISDGIFGMHMVEGIAVLALETAFHYVADLIDTTINVGETEKLVDIEGLKTTFEKVLGFGLEIVGGIDFNNDNYFEQAGNVMLVVGKLLDTFKKDFSPVAWRELMPAVMGMLEDMLFEAIDGGDLGFKLPDELVNAIRDCLGNIISCPSFEEEFAKYADIMNDIGALVDSLSGEGEFDITSLDLAVVGNILDTIRISHIFGDPVFSNIVTGFIGMAGTLMGELDDDDPMKLMLDGLLSQITDNITAFNESGEKYADALPELMGLFGVFMDIFDAGITDPLEILESPLFAELGAALDAINANKLLKGVPDFVLGALLSIAGETFLGDEPDMLDPMNIAISDIFTILGENITDNDICYEQEFVNLQGFFATIMGLMDDPEAFLGEDPMGALTGILDALNGIVNGDAGADPVVPPSQLITAEVVEVIDRLIIGMFLDMAPGMMTGAPSEFGDLITEMLTNYGTATEVNYGMELANLLDLFGVAMTLPALTTETDTEVIMQKIGEALTNLNAIADSNGKIVTPGVAYAVIDLISDIAQGVFAGMLPAMMDELFGGIVAQLNIELDGLLTYLAVAPFEKEDLFDSSTGLLPDVEGALINEITGLSLAQLFALQAVLSDESPTGFVVVMGTLIGEAVTLLLDPTDATGHGLTTTEADILLHIDSLSSAIDNYLASLA
ncbi:MAG: hypothetical protein FWE53_03415 [Firmicutes bacterium]|nr:hypothetical protein [Bacillota bacterium]